MTQEINYLTDCWICRQPLPSLPSEAHSKRLDEFGFTVHAACFDKLEAENNGVKPVTPN
jgi:hypothetical protein